MALVDVFLSVVSIMALFELVECVFHTQTRVWLVNLTLPRLLQEPAFASVLVKNAFSLHDLNIGYDAELCQEMSFKISVCLELLLTVVGF